MFKVDIPVKYYVIPALLIGCIIGAVFLGGTIFKWVLVIIGSVIGGLGIAGFVTLALLEEKNTKLLLVGSLIVAPVIAVLGVVLGGRWLALFLPYAGILTGLLLVIDTWRRKTNPTLPIDPKKK